MIRTSRQLVRGALPAFAALAATWISACGTTEGQVGPEPQPPTIADELAGLAPMERVLRLEATRSDGGGVLQRLAREGEPQVRARAALALGRLPYPEFGPEVSEALHAALADPSSDVRANAAFGLGLRADPSSAAALRGAWNDPEPVVRARVVEAASRLEDAELHKEVLYSLFADPSFRVRVEAAVAPHRWPVDAPNAAEVDNALARSALTGFESPEQGAEGAPAVEPARTEATDVVWRDLFSLQRRAHERARAGQREATPERAREALLFWARPEARGETRLFAVKGLGALPPSEQVREALYAGLESADWRVVCEAANGLGQMPHPEALTALQRALAHPSSHVRGCVALALGRFGEARQGARELLDRALGDPSPNVRAAALQGLALLEGPRAQGLLADAALDTDFRVRYGVAQALEHLEPALAGPILIPLTRDPDSLVAIEATGGLARVDSPAARARLRELAAGRDNALRLAAIEALGAQPDPDELALFESAWAGTTGDMAAEVRVAALQAAAEVGGEEALSLLRRGLATGGFHERRVAREALARLEPESELPPLGAPPRLSPPPPLGREPARPTVEVETSRGLLVFELLPEVAPQHVRNFLELAAADHYDGLRFHRVVPDFVVQGGDYRGDGSGGQTWNGAPLPAEFGPRKFDLGALGMPRSDDPESGGSQIFVTHRPTPHLDGRYTLFGELRGGFDVLDALEIGDRIVDVRLRGARP